MTSSRSRSGGLSRTRASTPAPENMTEAWNPAFRTLCASRCAMSSSSSTMSSRSARAAAGASVDMRFKYKTGTGRAPRARLGPALGRTWLSRSRLPRVMSSAPRTLRPPSTPRTRWAPPTPRRVALSNTVRRPASALAGARSAAAVASGLPCALRRTVSRAEVACFPRFCTGMARSPSAAAGTALDYGGNRRMR
jgi:hypothetical protein